MIITWSNKNRNFQALFRCFFKPSEWSEQWSIIRIYWQKPRCHQLLLYLLYDITTISLYHTISIHYTNKRITTWWNPTSNDDLQYVKSSILMRKAILVDPSTRRRKLSWLSPTIWNPLCWCSIAVLHGQKWLINMVPQESPCLFHLKLYQVTLGTTQP
jgi:hypothetical protein